MSWDFSGAVVQGLLYIAFIGVAGTTAAEWMFNRSTPPSAHIYRWLRRYQVCALGIGLLCAPLSFLLFVGAINQRGLLGMFDPELWWFLILDPPAVYALTKWIGFCLVLSSFCFRANSGSKRLAVYVGLITLVVSFTVRGHLSDAALWVKVLLGLHVAAIAFWAGMLLPLWRLAREPNVHAWQTVYARFGHDAVWVVLSLLVSGVVMTVVHLQSLSELWTTAYGQLFSLKLLAVAALLLLAALNKWIIVPALAHPHIAAMFSRVIMLEMVFVTFILSCTAVFTLIVGYS